MLQSICYLLLEFCYSEHWQCRRNNWQPQGRELELNWLSDDEMFQL